MGRDYKGNIKGTFLFGIQPSNAANRFGSIGIYNPIKQEIKYTFTRDEHYLLVERELRKIRDTSSADMVRVIEFFSTRESYTNVEAEEILGLNYRSMLKEYADYNLGTQILECLQKKEKCVFTGEC